MKLLRQVDSEIEARKIRVGHVVFNIATGGLEVGLRRLIQGLGSDHYEHVVVSVLHDGVIRGARVLAMHENPVGFKFLAPKFARIFARERLDIVHTHNLPTVEAIAGAWIARVPAIIHCEHGRNAGDSLREPLRRALMRRVYYAMADQILTVSDDLKQHLEHTLHLRGDRVQMIGDGVDTSMFASNADARTRIRQALRLSDDAFVVGTVARFDPVKDLATLLKSIEMLVARGIDAHAVLVGDGAERERLGTMARESRVLCGRVHFSGDVTNVPAWLNALDAFTLTSLFEGTSVALLEAMAVGVPPVVTCVGGNPEIVCSPEIGFLFTPKHANELADHLQTLATAPSMRAAIAAACRTRVERHYSFTELVRRYDQLYRRVLHIEADARATSNALVKGGAA